MRVLGIDPGSIVTGYGIVEMSGNSYTHIASGDIKLKKTLSLPEKLLVISKGITDLIKDFAPESVGVESVFFAKNARSALILGQARGAVLLTIASMELEVFEYSPTEVKKAVTGHGRAAKEDMQKMMGLLLGKDLLTSSDSADALAIAICHLNSVKINRRIKK